MRTFLATALLPLVLLIAPAAVAAEAPFRAGFTELSVTDPVSGDIVSFALWFPTTSAEGTVRRGPFVMAAAQNAAPAPGRHPLIVVSHGTGGSALGHRDTGLHLARHGYVVAAPMHARDNFRDSRGAGTWLVLSGRPKTVSAVIDRLLSDKTFGSAVDQSRIGVFGFSMGGYTALALIGARPAMLNVSRHCWTNREDVVFCGARPAADLDVGRDLDDLADPRVRAAVIAAPAAPFFADDSFRDVTVPVRLYRAENDRILRHPWHAERVRKLLPMEPEYVVVEGAGHYAFLALFSKEMQEEYPDLAIDPDGFDRLAMHARMNAEIADFFGRTLP